MSTDCRSRCTVPSPVRRGTATTSRGCTTRSSPARRGPATCSTPGGAPATRTPPRARTTSSSTWSTGSKARCARSPWSAWTPASPRRGCFPASKLAARPMWPGYATTGCSTAWPARISGAHPDGRRQSHGYGVTRWTTRPGARSRARRVVLVVLERPGDLLLEHFWLLTSISAAAVPAGELLAHYRQRGTAEGHFGELMDVLAPALSSTSRSKRHYRGSPLPALPTSLDAVARNEALLLLHLMAYELMHAGRRMMEIATGTGCSLRRFRERVLRVGGRVLIHARRITLVIAETAARHWAALWPRFERCAWPGT